MPDLTARQQQLYDFILAGIENDGCQPSVREMADHCGIRSSNGVEGHLRALHKKGLIDFSGRARALRILGVRFQRRASSPTG